MKKMFLFVFTLMVLLVNRVVLEADCASDKNDINLYIESAPIYIDGRIDIYLEIYGVREGTILKIYNDFENETHTYTYADVDDYDDTLGTITPNVTSEINFKVDVYSESCGDEIIDTMELGQSKINVYAFSDFCKMNAYKSELCRADADTEGMTEEEVKKKVEQQIKQYDFRIKMKSVVKSYYLFVLIPMLIVIVIFAIRIILLKKKQKEKLK